MPLLRMREARFAANSVAAGPLTLDLEPGERVALHCASQREATIVALLACGIVKASNGLVLIDDFDPRVQSVACKRAAAFVPHEPFALDDREFALYIEYRAALWNLEPLRARAQADRLRSSLAGMHETLVYPLIAALIARPKLVVLDRPLAVHAKLILAAIGERAVLSTHTDAAAAHAFAPDPLRVLRATPA
jgi:ABC-type Na+ transport system ATPase subunit NatA